MSILKKYLKIEATKQNMPYLQKTGFKSIFKKRNNMKYETTT